MAMVLGLSSPTSMVSAKASVEIHSLDENSTAPPNLPVANAGLLLELPVKVPLNPP